jgi:hypothetical protein
MNAFVIIGQRHGSDSLEQIGDVIPAGEAREAFMPFRVLGAHPEFQRAWLCRLESEWDMRFAKSDPSPDGPVLKTKRKG